MSTANDPVRLLADPGCPDSQRALLRLGADIAPPPGAEARVWAALAGALGGAAAAGTAVDPSGKTITTTANVKASLAALKIVALTAGLTALVAFGIAVFSPPKDVPPPEIATPAPAVETPAPVPPAQAPPAEAAPPDLAPAPRAHRAAASPARKLVEETTLIRDARQALRAGDAARALRLLEESRRLFPSGVLQQERERLAIEALVKAGRRAEATARASAFLRRHPDSPHASELRALGLGASGSR